MPTISSSHKVLASENESQLGSLIIKARLVETTYTSKSLQVVQAELLIHLKKRHGFVSLCCFHINYIMAQETYLYYEINFRF